MHETTGTDASSVHTIQIAITKVFTLHVAKETAVSENPFFLHDYEKEHPKQEHRDEEGSGGEAIQGVAENT